PARAPGAEPFDGLRGVLAPVPARAAVRAAVPTDRPALLDQHAAASAGLAGGGRRPGAAAPPRSPPRVYCLGGAQAPQPTPSGSAAALGTVGMLAQRGRRHVLVLARAVGRHARERRRRLQVGPWARHLLRCWRPQL